MGPGGGSQPSPPPTSSCPLSLSLGKPRTRCAHFTDEETEAFPLIDKYAELRPNGTFFSIFHTGAKERTHQQKKHSSYEDELSEVLEKQNDQAELKGQCRPVWPETRGGRMKITVVMIDRGLLGVRSPSFRPCKVAHISFSLQMGKLSPKEVEVPSQGIIGDVNLGLSHSKALDRSHLPTAGTDTPGQEVSGLADGQLRLFPVATAAGSPPLAPALPGISGALA